MKHFATSKNVINVFMFGLTGLCTLLTVGILFFILGYLVWNGASALSWSFFTKLPAPVGEIGGGMANAIIGSGKVLFLATLVGVPIGFLGGVYLNEYGHKTMAFIIRYATDLLNGVPSIVIGIVVYTLVVHPMRHFSTVSGGIALGMRALGGVSLLDGLAHAADKFLVFENHPMAVENLQIGVGHQRRHARLERAQFGERARERLFEALLLGLQVAGASSCDRWCS